MNKKINLMKRFLGFFLMVLMSCSSLKVVTDFEDTTDFSNYKTYGFFQNAGNDLNELDVTRIIRVIDTTLQQKGFKRSDTADFYIDFSSKKSDELPRTSLAIGFGNVGFNNAFGVSGGIPVGNKKVLEVISIEFLTAKKEQLFWQAFLESKVKQNRTPIEKEVYFQKTISKILSTYPPK
ncbi:MAG: DUF4136 domain-containing protein [Flavobacteriaceae bacterium CG_4_10_14_3_um_filter_31_253]|nr:MAG: DUF4136 domain-containing protein [Flavobacteriaceae bacterium CG17_big_fil_post_rev_8_21_14_2_50_31_13]PIX13023.1 MAG: DUF4136 domain-containing protein [Flavobacteriaceae bacterium CG_4_8_14_3_um_filter_31_8]PIY15235.1 MAG: DUF4136 domain-containing protein [Flavobacteriaceae bacterium CG_4_10_14_3_um_filter_31_253]PIZ11987.1 MAG: DUF4136 domain-containing protein [Flavobacteriaceae bacterium CG_4_10_14_0_8_um_filter_31_99]PJC09430.1 MAG: DUF4136 domain-containing protein [Flavobacter